MKAKLSEEEIDTIEAALLLLGAHSAQKSDMLAYNELANRISMILKKLQATQAISETRSIIMEPFK